MLAVMLGALVTLGPAGALRGEVALEASQNARSTSVDGAPDPVRAELALTSRVALETDGRLRLRAAYAPMVLVPADLAGGDEAASAPLADRGILLHRGAAGVEWHPAGRTWTLFARGAVGFGETLLLVDPLGFVGQGSLPTSGGTVDPISTTERIRYRGAVLESGAVFPLTRVTTLSLTTGATRSGGADDAARRQLPLLEEARAEATVDRQLDSRNTVGLGLTANRARIGEDPGGDTGYLGARLVWHHQVTRLTGLRTAAGLALTYEREDPDEAADVADPPPVLPWVEATADHVPEGGRPSLRFQTGLAPVADRLAGTLDLRGHALVAVGWAPFRRWEFSGRGSSELRFETGPGAASRPHTMVHGAGIAAGHQLARDLRLVASAGSTWQETDREGLPAFREDLVLVQLSTRLVDF